MNANIIEKTRRIIQDLPDATIALVDEQGFPFASTISPIKTDGIYAAYFATGMKSHKARCIQASGKASVCFHKGGDNVTLVGTAALLTDAQLRYDLWDDSFLAYFSEGRDDPNYVILAFTTERVTLWVEGESTDFTIDAALRVQSRCGLLCDGCDYREPCGCGRCIETMGHPFHGECPVAVCCQEKGFAHCGECCEMPCEKLNEYSCLDPEHGDKPAGARLSMLKDWTRRAVRA